MTVALHIWADASFHLETGIAFGAFVISTGEPVVRKLRSKASQDAEFEIMAMACRASPVGSVLFTDLRDWDRMLHQWNYWQLSRFKVIVAKKEIEVRYAPPEHRPQQYFKCHQAAIAALRAEVKKRSEHNKPETAQCRP